MNEIINTAKSVILQPNEFWAVAQNREEDTTSLIKKVVIPFSLIPTIAAFIGYGVIGTRSILGNVSSLKWGFNQALITFIAAIAGIFIIATVINLLAPHFGCKKNMNKTLALVSYSYIPSLVAGISYIIPSLSIIALIGSIYGLYVLYLGFKPMTNVSEDKATSYLIVSIIVAIVASIIVMSILTSVIVFSPFSNFGF